ncbi:MULTISPECIES: hypothetical protein [unclassified Enterococcus]|jgi:hypothetical protein|uniref:hypothetical protein n=1 Tax=unclassified Enterococcus TaxID=2608891 RepID=UPI003D2B1ED1
MEKPLIKTFAVTAVGLGAAAICVFGYYINNQKQHEQRIAYAESAILDQKDTLASLSQEAGNLYSTKEKIFLKPKVTKDETTRLSSRLSSVKLSADDYGIDESELPKEAAAIQTTKETVTNQLKDAEAKLNVQESVNQLFTENVSNWQQAADDVIIRENITSKDVANIRENLNFFKDSAWKTSITQYLGFADAQIAQVDGLNQLFDTLLKDGQVTASATYDQYLTALNQIEQVRNEKIKEKYTAMAETVAQQMGYGTMNY